MSLDSLNFMTLMAWCQHPSQQKQKRDRREREERSLDYLISGVNFATYLGPCAMVVTASGAKMGLAMRLSKGKLTLVCVKKDMRGKIVN